MHFTSRIRVSAFKLTLSFRLFDPPLESQVRRPTYSWPCHDRTFFVKKYGINQLRRSAAPGGAESHRARGDEASAVDTAGLHSGKDLRTAADSFKAAAVNPPPARRDAVRNYFPSPLAYDKYTDRQGDAR